MARKGSVKIPIEYGFKLMSVLRQTSNARHKKYEVVSRLYVAVSLGCSPRSSCVVGWALGVERWKRKMKPDLNLSSV